MGRVIGDHGLLEFSACQLSRLFGLQGERRVDGNFDYLSRRLLVQATPFLVTAEARVFLISTVLF